MNNKKRIAFNKLIIKKLILLNETADEQYRLDTFKFRVLFSETKEELKNIKRGVGSEEHKKQLELAADLNYKLFQLEMILKEQALIRTERFVSSIKILACEVNSFYNRQKNINRARNNEYIKEGLKNGTVERTERPEIVKKLIKSTLKYRDDNERLKNKYKYKLQPKNKRG